MREFTISHLEEGQRLDKYLTKCLPNTTKSFLYKMLRKKNITLNNKKAEGNEKLSAGDSVKMFFAEETFLKFAGKEKQEIEPIQIKADKKPDFRPEILYEDKDILILNKPVGILSQKARKEDYSLVEAVTDYLLESGTLTDEQLRTFHPGICNRLDRNTSGIVVAGKSICGLQTMTAAFKDRTLHKYYICMVKGRVEKRSRVKGWLYKDERNNKVTISTRAPQSGEKNVLPIETEYIPVCTGKNMTLLKVNLLTGRSHQIRAHLAYLGHPLAGDEKYGDLSWNKHLNKLYKIKYQMLHAYQLEIPQRSLTVTTEIPEIFCRVLKGEQLWQHGIQEDLEALR